jgi:hypothetical protein
MAWRVLNRPFRRFLAGQWPATPLAYVGRAPAGARGHAALAAHGAKAALAAEVEAAVGRLQVHDSVITRLLIV